MNDAGQGPDDSGSGSDKRAAGRVACRMAVHTGEATWWEASNISRTGLFLTGPPLPRGAIVQICLETPDGALWCSCEVCHVGPGGMGLRFVELSASDVKRLRSTIVGLQKADELRGDIVTKIEHTRPALVGTTAIGELLARAAAARAEVELVGLEPGQLVIKGRVQEASGGHLVVRSTDRPLEPDRSAYVALTLDFVCYSFATRTGDSAAGAHRVAWPERIYTNERRDDVRIPADGLQLEGADFGLAPVLETSTRGLSVWFAGPPSVRPGDTLPAVHLVPRHGPPVPMPILHVRHVSPLSSDEGPGGFRVGLATTTSDTVPPVTREIAAPTRLERAWTDAKAVVSLWWHRFRPTASPPHVVRQIRLRNARGLKVAAAFQATWRDDTKRRAPLLLVVPGFGGRKEQMAGLSRYAVDAFASLDQPLAVLRLDGTNNIGESDNDDGYGQVGLDTQHYTIGGVLDDVDAALAWAKHNPLVDPERIVLMSVSFSSIAVRHGLATRDWSAATMWIAHMGAADAKDAVLHVSGHIDAIGRYAAGFSIGRVMLIGCEVDGDHFCADLLARRAATLGNAEEDIARIRIPIVWNVGRHDAWMDPRRVERLLAVKVDGDPAQSTRRLAVFDSGHVPTSGAEALRQFAEITAALWEHVHGGPIPPYRATDAATVKLATDAEFARVRSAPLRDLEGWWRRYLLGDGTLGFDILEHSPHFRAFAETEAELVAPRARRVLDIGCGTGLISARIAEREPATLTLADLVPKALERALQRTASRSPTGVSLNADGNLRMAIRRYRQGRLDLATLRSRFLAAGVDDVDKAWPDDTSLATLLQGDPSPARAASDPRRVAIGLDLVDLVHSSAAPTQGGEGLPLPALRRLHPDAMGAVVGLPFADGSFDAVLASLLVSYLKHPDDLIAEIFRVLVPGGTFVMSSMKSAADTSKLFLDLVATIEAGELDHLPDTTREGLLTHGRAFLDNAASLFRLEEEGHFRFYDEHELRALASEAGFVDPLVVTGFGDPPQAVLLRCRKP